MKPEELRTLAKQLVKEKNIPFDKAVNETIDTFDLGFELNYTLAEIGKVFGISRERTRQIEQKALKKLKHPKLTQSFREYMMITSDFNYKQM